MTDSDDLEALRVLFWILFGLISLTIAVLPTIIAFWRRHPNRWLIAAINIAFGATLIGWLGALVWALHAAHKPDDPTQSAGGESGLNLFVNDVQRVQLIPAEATGAGTGKKSDADSVLVELERVAKLRDAGNLTEAEYDAMKAEVFKRMRSPPS